MTTFIWKRWTCLKTGKYCNTSHQKINALVQPFSIQKKIKEITHQAFWDLLKEELEEDPPQYERALTLLEEIKEWLLACLLPHQTRTQQEIKDKLDTTVIKQQIESNTLDLHVIRLVKSM